MPDLPDPEEHEFFTPAPEPDPVPDVTIPTGLPTVEGDD